MSTSPPRGPAQPVQHNWAGQPAIIVGEDADGYRELFAQVERVLAPRDVLEDMWMRDVVDIAWDVFRLRRLKANLLRFRAREALRDLLDNVVRDPRPLADKWHARDEEAVALVDRLLKSAGMSMDTLMAATLRQELDEVERIEALIASAENRRSSALADIERYRATFAQKLSQALDRAGSADGASPTVPQLPATGERRA